MDNLLEVPPSLDAMLNYIIVASSSQCKFEIRDWVRVYRNFKLFLELLHPGFYRSIVSLRDDICQGSDEGCNLRLTSEIVEVESNSHFNELTSSKRYQ